MLHHATHVFELLVTLGTLVWAIRNVVSGRRTNVLKLGLGREHVPGLLENFGYFPSELVIHDHLMPGNEVVHPIPCSLLTRAVGAGTHLNMLNSIGRRPVKIMISLSF